MGIENNIPEDWVETTLGDVCEIKYGKDHKKLNDGNIPCFGSGGLMRRVSEILYDKPSVLIPRKGTLTNLFFIDEPFWTVDTLFYTKINSSKILPKYLFYKLKTYDLESLNVGSAVPSLTTAVLNQFPFTIPNIPEQKAIAKVLTVFDDKIELLQAQNKTLETMAQTIFKEWFGKYQQELSPPNGWRTFSLSELVDTINGYSYKGKELVEESNEALVTLKSFDRNGGFQTRGFKPFKGLPKTQHEVKIGDLVVAHTDLTQDAEVLGNPAFIFDNGGFEKMYITMYLVKVVSKNKDVGPSFLYYLMKDRYFKGHCVGYSNGTTVLHLSKKAIPEYELFLPENFDLIKKFTKIANDTTNKISLNKDAIKSLTKTRDTLLPKLMSGQVRVNIIKQLASA
jgi:type I restriction enzyme S subunit